MVFLDSGGGYSEFVSQKYIIYTFVYYAFLYDSVFLNLKEL